MLHFRVIAPSSLTPRVRELLSGHGSITAISHHPGAALKPHGDLWLCDVAHEDGSVVLAELRELDVHHLGTITIEEVAVCMSDAAEAAEEEADGSPGDAVLWERVEASTWSSADLTAGFLVFMWLATMLSAVAILTDSAILLIGAMVVGPEFGPLAGICVATVQRRPQLALRSLWALLVGFAVGALGTWMAVCVLIALGMHPTAVTRTQTFFVSHPDGFTVLAALLAGVAGMLSLSTAKSGALIGVLISVTTVPALANIAVAAAYVDGAELRGASLQLVVNVASILVAGTATLTVQRMSFVGRMQKALRLRRRRRRAR